MTQPTELYGTGKDLPKLHPDVEINTDETIGILCAKLDFARAVIARGLDLNVVSEAGVSFKSACRHAMLETAPSTFAEVHNNHG